jgi:hypothetical protein
VCKFNIKEVNSFEISFKFYFVIMKFIFSHGIYFIFIQINHKSNIFDFQLLFTNFSKCLLSMTTWKLTSYKGEKNTTLLFASLLLLLSHSQIMVPIAARLCEKMWKNELHDDKIKFDYMNDKRIKNNLQIPYKPDCGST